MIRRLLVLLSIGVLLVAAAGCSGRSNLSEADQAVADKAWDQQTGIAQKALCSDLADPKKAEKAANDLEDTLLSADLKKNDNDVLKTAAASPKRRERAAALVEYIQGKC